MMGKVNSVFGLGFQVALSNKELFPSFGGVSSYFYIEERQLMKTVFGQSSLPLLSSGFNVGKNFISASCCKLIRRQLMKMVLLLSRMK